jgi:hypothetical protein
LQIKEKQFIQLSEEIDFTRSFVYLLKQRFRNGLEIDIQLKTISSNDYILPLSLQTLVENAVKHNIVSPEKPLKITIKEKKGELVVGNNLQIKRQTIRSYKMGLENLQERYNLMMQKPIKITKEHNKFEVELPLKKGDDNENSNNRR